MCPEVPQTPLGFNDTLEGLTEPSKAVVLTVTMYYSEWTQIKFRNGEHFTGQSPGETRHKLAVVLSRGVVQRALISPSRSA